MNLSKLIAIFGFTSFLLTEAKKIKITTKGHYDVCVSNKGDSEIDQISYYDVGTYQYNCDLNDCSQQTNNYNITCGEKRLLIKVNYPIARHIISNGTETYFLLGKITEGHWTGATVDEMVRNISPDLTKCPVDNSVTITKSDTAVITIEKGDEKITCYGSYTRKFEPRARDICKTDACIAAGQLLKSNLNLSADPCDDFYEFACGGYVATHTVPNDKTIIGQRFGIEDTLKQKVLQVLNGPNKARDSKSVKYTRDLYRACIDSEELELKGITPLINAINLVGGLPISDQSVYVDSTYDWRNALAKIVAYLGKSYLFYLHVLPDLNDSMVNRMAIDNQGFVMDSASLADPTSNPRLISAYKKYITDTFIVLGVRNNSQTNRDVDNMINFESSLAKCITQGIKEGNPFLSYRRLSFAELRNITFNNVDWLYIINNIYVNIRSSIRLTPNDVVVLEDAAFLQCFSRLIVFKPKRVIANYFGWRIAQTFGVYTVEALRKLKFNFDLVNSNAVTEESLSDICIEYLKDGLKWSLARIYVDKYFSRDDKREVCRLAEGAKRAFIDLIPSNNWLSSVTRREVFAKASNQQENCGYPDWILDNTQLDGYYSLTKNVGKAFKAIEYIQQIKTRKNFEDVNKHYDRTFEFLFLTNFYFYYNWAKPVVHPFIETILSENSNIEPAGVMQYPIYIAGGPAYFNYGSIGALLANVVVIHFQPPIYSTSFDENGNLRRKWSSESTTNYYKKADCFVQQYSSITDATTNLQLNGNNTNNIDVVDNGGLRSSFRSYRNYIKSNGEPQRLSSIPQFTPNQLFFLSYANLWCAVIKPEALPDYIQNSPNSPPKYRVNVPVSNLKEFAYAFNCRPNSNMNPTNKCVVW